MDIVDSQIHLGPGGIDAMIAAMDAVGIQSALIDEFWIGTALMPSYMVADGRIRRPSTPTAELAALTWPDRFSYLIRVDRNDPEMPSIVRMAGDKPEVRAIRISPGLSQGELKALCEGGYDDLLSTTSNAGIPVVFVAIPGHAPSLAGAMRKFTDLKFVIDHCGMPSGGGFAKEMGKLGVTDPPPVMGDTSDEDGKAAEFEKVLRLADEHPNAGLKWSHAQEKFNVAGYPFDNLRPWLRQALDAFGAERMMWAGDAVANKTGESWAELLYWLIDNPDMTAAERAHLLGRTARAWLDWPLAGGESAEQSNKNR